MKTNNAESHCDNCGCRIDGKGKVEKLYWTARNGRRTVSTYRLCGDCNREDLLPYCLKLEMVD